MDMNRTAVALPNCIAEKLHADLHNPVRYLVVRA